MRLLFASVGKPHCHLCGNPISRQSPDQIVDMIAAYPEGSRVVIMAPVVRDRKGEFKKLFETYLKKGYLKARVDGRVYDLEDEIKLTKTRTHTLEVIVHRIIVKKAIRRRLESSVQAAMNLAEGLVTVSAEGIEERLFSQRQACIDCGVSIPALEPRSFSFNSRHGACPACNGTGVQKVALPDNIVPDPAMPVSSLRFSIENGSIARFLHRSLEKLIRKSGVNPDTPFEKVPAEIRNLFFYGNAGARSKRGAKILKGEFEGVCGWLEELSENEEYERSLQGYEQVFSNRDCPKCDGSRLRAESRAVKLNNLAISEYARMPLEDARTAFSHIVLSEREEEIAGQVLQEIRDRIDFLLNVGVGYLSLDRPAASLSGGEGQRIRLATQIGSRLRGVLYVLDEPSIGLHPRDNSRLLDTLENLKRLGNTIIVVEHDEDTMRRSDHIVDLGPMGGREGGAIVAAGTVSDISEASESLTGRYLKGDLAIECPPKRRKGNGKKITISGARHNNLKNLTVDFPLGLFLCVTGVSGAGKSSLVDEILYRALVRKLHKAATNPGLYDRIRGIEHLDKVIEIDQSPIGRTPRSNPATYTGLFTPIRELFAMLPESRVRGYKPGRFSFNVKGGRCEDCQGDGMRRIEMSFLPDVHVLCETCLGKRYNRETLAVKYKGYSVADLLGMNIEDAGSLLENLPPIAQKLKTLKEVGLGYIQLGQPATTLSGGEAQRVKLSRELSRRATGKTLYILDEPTTGLHFHDVKKLLDILNSLVDRGNTVVVIEHNLDVVKMADWIIDLGPEGGKGGGKIVAKGTPERVASIKKSATGIALRKILI
ncbi:MAG: excinuclease ABC subunit UvrA, partial [Acidobacteriota bacterium]